MLVPVLVLTGLGVARVWGRGSGGVAARSSGEDGTVIGQLRAGVASVEEVQEGLQDAGRELRERVERREREGRNGWGEREDLVGEVGAGVVERAEKPFLGGEGRVNEKEDTGEDVAVGKGGVVVESSAVGEGGSGGGVGDVGEGRLLPEVDGGGEEEEEKELQKVWLAEERREELKLAQMRAQVEREEYLESIGAVEVEDSGADGESVRNDGGRGVPKIEKVDGQKREGGGGAAAIDNNVSAAEVPGEGMEMEKIGTGGKKAETGGKKKAST